MDATVPTVYQPRRPRDSPLCRLVEDQFEALLEIHEERFESRFGRLRSAARRAVEKFLDCGILGFARVRCDECRAEFLVANEAISYPGVAGITLTDHFAMLPTASVS